jgi:hypothetical protein
MKQIMTNVTDDELYTTLQNGMEEISLKKLSTQRRNAGRP